MAKPRAPRNQIETHPNRLSIELSRLKGLSLDAISAKFGVHRDAIARHMAKLDPDYKAALSADVPIAELAERAAEVGGTLLDNLTVLRSGLMAACLAAKASDNHHAFASLARVALEVNKELGKFTGEMVNAPTITNNITNVAVLMNSPLMGQLQTMLADRLAPFPEAFHAVIEGLAELENPKRLQVIDARAA